MPMPAHPPKNDSSPFSSFRGHHVGLRVRDFEAARTWYVEKLDFRVLTGTANNAYAPAAVSGITSALNISAGNDDSCAVLAGGLVRCWGINM